MLNNVHFVALHVVDVHNAFFCHFQSRSFVKFDAILMLVFCSLV